MKVLTTFSSGAKCFLDEVTMTFTFGEVESPRTKLRTPLIMVQIGYPDLIPISGIIGEMVRRRVVPEVHIWDSEASDTYEVVVYFRAPRPRKTAVKQIAGVMYTAAMGVVKKWDQLATAGHVRMNRSETERFIANFEREQRAEVYVADATEDKPLRDALQIFTVMTLGRKPFDFAGALT